MREIKVLLKFAIKFFLKSVQCVLSGGRQDYKKIVILGRSRVGSNLLVSYLNSHPEIQLEGELFNRENLRYNFIISRLPIFYMNLFAFCGIGGRYRFRGFKLFYYHARKGKLTQVWGKLKTDNNVYFLHIKRKNFVKVFVSRLLAEKTDRWVQKKQGRKGEIQRIHVKPEELIRDYKKTKQNEIFCDEFFKDRKIMTLYYEDLVASPDKILRKMERFLQLENNSIKLKTDLRKQSKAGIHQTIENYDELKKYFKNTELAEFLQG